jgi:type I restriction enzyme M protein
MGRLFPGVYRCLMYVLDIKNPYGKEELEQLPPEELIESILAKERHIAEIVTEIKGLLARAEQL